MKFAVLAASVISILMVIGVIMVSADDDDDVIVEVAGHVVEIDSNDILLDTVGDGLWDVQVNTCPEGHILTDPDGNEIEDLNAWLNENIPPCTDIVVIGEAKFDDEDPTLLVELDAFDIYADDGTLLLHVRGKPGPPPW